MSKHPSRYVYKLLILNITMHMFGFIPPPFKCRIYVLVGDMFLFENSATDITALLIAGGADL